MARCDAASRHEALRALRRALLDAHVRSGLRRGVLVPSGRPTSDRGTVRHGLQEEWTVTPIRDEHRAANRAVLAVLGSVALGGVLGAVSGLLAADPAAARTTIGVFETSLSIEALRGTGIATNRVLIEARGPGTVLIVFEDVIPAENSSWQPVEFGSTPYTLAGRISAEPAELRYEGDLIGTRHTFEVMLRADDLDDRARAGFVNYRFVPDPAPGAPQDTGVQQAVAARVRIGAWPTDLTSLPARITLTELRLVRDPGTVTGLIDRVLPDLPRVVNRGPATVRARTTNVGDVLVLVDTTLTLTRLPWSAALPLLDVPGSTVITLLDRPRLLLPKKSVSSQVTSTASLDGGEIDRLPVVGLVRIGAESSARMGATLSEVSDTATYLVAPWKEVLLLMLLYLAASTGRRRLAAARAEAPDTIVLDGSTGEVGTVVPSVRDAAGSGPSAFDDIAARLAALDARVRGYDDDRS